MFTTLRFNFNSQFLKEFFMCTVTRKPNAVMSILFLLSLVLGTPAARASISGGYIPVDLSPNPSLLGQSVGVSSPLDTCLSQNGGSGEITYYWSTSRGGTAYELGVDWDGQNLIWNYPSVGTGKFYFYAYFAPNDNNCTGTAVSLSSSPVYTILTVNSN
jgi:hypothetical protein